MGENHEREEDEERILLGGNTMKRNRKCDKRGNEISTKKRN